LLQCMAANGIVSFRGWRLAAPESRGGRKVADEEIIGRPNIKAPIGAGLGASAILW
jgi:hypothetical protein